MTATLARARWLQRSLTARNTCERQAAEHSKGCMRSRAASSSSSQGLQHALPLPQAKQQICICSEERVEGSVTLHRRPSPKATVSESSAVLNHCTLPCAQSDMRTPATTTPALSHLFAKLN